MVSCVAIGCSNRSGRRDKVSFHKFPVDPVLRALWIKNVNRNGWTPSAFSRICSDHFPKSDLNKTYHSGKVHLREGAVPTIFPFRNCLQNFIQERKPPTKRLAFTDLSDVVETFPQTILGENAPSKFMMSSLEDFRPSKKKMKMELRTEQNVAEASDPFEKRGSAPYYDEEESYDISNYTSLIIKVEPGLTSDGVYEDGESEFDKKDFLTGCNRLKEEADSDSMNEDEQLDSIVEIDNANYIKQEDGSYQNFLHRSMKIKKEPDFSEHDTQHGGYVT